MKFSVCTEDASEACHLPIDHVRQSSVPRSGRAAQEVRQERRLRLLRGNRLSAWEPISQIIAQLLVRSWDNGWDNRRGSTRDRIALKRRQRNDLVGFELFLRSQMLYPTELRARSETLHCQYFTASSSSISTSSFGSL